TRKEMLALKAPSPAIGERAGIEDNEKNAEAGTRDTESNERLTFSIESDNSGAIWYRLQERFSECASTYLKSSRAKSAEVLLRFVADDSHATLQEATLLGPRESEGEALESCIESGLSGQIFAKTLRDTRVRFSLEEVFRTPHQADGILHDLPNAVGPNALGPSRGSDDAAVALVVYTDFQCTFCAKALATMDELLEKYDGKIRIVAKLYPLKASSRRLAMATVAAAMQDGFWPMHDLIFANQDRVELGEVEILGFAKDIGLNVALFITDWNSEDVADLVQQDLDDGKALGVSGTPTIFVNHNKIVGAQPIENFEALIDETLEATTHP
ncbi:MAG: thioredoxin domain-containing protein, partial [Kofleriaceae bacterium]|nr:thioredoxin domain-containing protein [Kofleriaceae bacterium]